MTESRHKTKGLVWILLSAWSLSGCFSRAPQQPLVYPVIVPVYSPSGYQMGSQQGYAVPPTSPVPAPVVYPTPTDYSNGAAQGGFPQPSQQQGAAPVSIPVGQPMNTMPVQGMAAGSRQSGYPTMSENQRLQMADALFRYSGGAVDPITKELAEVMQPALEASACGVGWLPDLVVRNSEAAQSRSLTPFESTPKHGTAQCLDVYQVDNWRVSPPSRVAFRVVFESPITHERASRRFELMRVHGGWRYLLMNEPF